MEELEQVKTPEDASGGEAIAVEEAPGAAPDETENETSEDTGHAPPPDNLAEAAEQVFGVEIINEDQPSADEAARARLKAVIEGVIYVTEEPLTLVQIANALGQPADRIKEVLEELTAEYAKPERGLSIRELAGGYKMATKPEHHEAVRQFVKSLKPPLKLSLAALETLAVIAYKQPITAPEIMEIRGVQGAGVLKTLIDRKLVATAGRKNVVGKPILYKTTKDFLVQFGLRDLSELPTLKEFEELGRLALSEPEPASPEEPSSAEETGQAAAAGSEPEPK